MHYLNRLGCPLKRLYRQQADGHIRTSNIPTKSIPGASRAVSASIGQSWPRVLFGATLTWVQKARLE